MNELGKIKEVTEDDNGYRQFIINCLGVNDEKKYFSISPFGIDFNPPIDTRLLTIDSRNNNAKFSVGVINKLKIADLSPGEPAIFSTDETGENIVSQTVHRNNGDIEINKGLSNGNILIKADGTIEFNGAVDFLTGFNDLKVGFDELKADYNNHIHKIPIGEVIISVSGGSGAPAVGVTNPAPINLSDTDTVSSASIDTSKKSNLKTE
jgi:hypothetical protein